MKYSVNETEMPLILPDRRIFGKAFFPQNKQGKLKTVILSHGYNSSYAYLADLAYALAETGVFAYCYDFCVGSSSSESSGKTTDMTIATETDDLKTVIGFIKALDCVDESNVYLYGESQGGFISALAAAELKDGIKGLYLLYPAFCIPDDQKARMAQIEQSKAETIELMGMTISKNFGDGIPDGDVFQYVGGYEGKVMIYHGNADELVKLSYSEKLAKSYKNAALFVYEGEGHGFSESARAELRSQICRDFE